MANLDALLAEYVEQKQFVETEKPYWLYLDAERGTELSFNLFNYFPGAHYKKAIDQALLEEADQELVPDGGKRYTETMYAWYDPDTDTYLSHVEAGNEFASPFFDEEDEARRFLEYRAQEIDDESRYEGLSLRKLKAKKVGEAVEVLTDQSGIQDFVPDGGHQIGNPQRDEVWFWYDATADMILQEEVEPYNVAGLFETEEDADRFIHVYANRYGVEDASHFEKYSADLTYQGQGPNLNRDEETQESTEVSEQADFEEFIDP